MTPCTASTPAPCSSATRASVVPSCSAIAGKSRPWWYRSASTTCVSASSASTCATTAASTSATTAADSVSPQSATSWDSASKLTGRPATWARVSRTCFGVSPVSAAITASGSPRPASDSEIALARDRVERVT